MISITRRIDGPVGIVRFDLSNGMHVTKSPRQIHQRSKFYYGLFSQPGGRSPGLSAFLGAFPTLQGALAAADDRQRKADVNLARMAYGEDYR